MTRQDYERIADEFLENKEVNVEAFKEYINSDTSFDTLTMAAALESRYGRFGRITDDDKKEELYKEYLESAFASYMENYYFG